LLPNSQPNSDFLGSECNEVAEGGRGGQPDAVAESLVSISSHGKFMAKGRPYPALLLSKKRAPRMWRNAEPAQLALSRELAANYR